MPEETTQLPVSPQEIQIQAPSLKERISAQKKKIFIGLGAFLGVLILVGAVFGIYKYAQRQIPIEPAEGPTPTLEATPTPDETADWETYTNTKYGYSIRYPEDKYTISQDNELLYSEENKIEVKTSFEDYLGYPPPEFLFALRFVNKETKEDPIRIWIFNNEENKNIDDWYEKYWYYPFTWGKGVPAVVEENKPVKEIEIGRQTGRYVYSDEMGKVKYIYLSTKGWMFLFGAQVGFDEIKKEELPSEIGLILSTFRFD